MEEKEGPSAKLDGQLFYEMFKTSPIGIALEDLQGRPLFANPALCSMLGFSEEEMRSKHRVDFSPSEDAKKDWALFEQLRTGLIDHYQIEKRFFRRDGSLFWGRLHISLLNHRPSPVVVALVDDITEKKMTQETLELAAKQMMAVTRCSRDLRYLWANQGCAELLQRPLDQIVGHSILEVLGNEAFESLRHHFERVLAGENVAYEEEVNYRSVGRRWISAAYTPTLNASGVVDGWVAVIADVTDRERAEDTARQSEAHLVAEAEALSRVNDLSGRLWRISDMQEGLEEMVVAVRSLLGTDKANIQLLDAQRGVLTIAAHYGFEQPFLEFFRQVSIEHPSACGRALAAGQRVVIEDIETDAAYAPLRSIARASGYRSVISTPLIGSGGSVLGILSTHSKSVYRPSEEALRRFDLYTRQAAGFIQRCQIEEALKKSEEMFSKAFRQTPLMLTVTSAKDGRFVEVNETKERISGWRRDELIGRTSVEMGIWVDPAQRVELIRRLSTQGTIRNFEVNFRTKYADVRVVLLSAELIEINGERCVLAVSEDITDLKRAEATLRESEERFRLVANTAPVMICMADVDMLCTYFNQRWLEFTGRSLQEELGKGWTEKVHPEDLGRYLATCTQAFDRREPFQMEYRLRRHDGQYRWIFHQGVPRFNADGSLAGYIGSGIDVTERKLAEEALSTVSQKLIEAHEEERTRIARELHDDIGQRLALLITNLARLGADDQTSRVEFREGIVKAKEDTSNLAHDIQALSHRLHSSKLEYLGLAKAAASYCSELADQHDVEIDLQSEDIPDDLSQEIALCLFRVLQEAMQNGIKHSRSQRFDVSFSRTPSDMMCLTVHDSGIGFDPSEAIKGKGLGFISMEERMKLVGGELSIESQPGKGTTIRAEVPLFPRAKSAHAG